MKQAGARLAAVTVDRPQVKRSHQHANPHAATYNLNNIGILSGLNPGN